MHLHFYVKTSTKAQIFTQKKLKFKQIDVLFYEKRKFIHNE